MKKWPLVVLLPLAFLSHVSAQTTTGVAIAKTCPGPAPVPPGTVFTCTFTVQNRDPAFSVNTLAVTNTVPFPGGVTTGSPCKQGGVTVTVLGPFGTATDTCTGAVDETAPACGGTDAFFSDQVAATGFDENGGTPLPVFASTTNEVTIAACTPTPTNTPTNTPTTPTNTPTSTPTRTRTPTSSPVPGEITPSTPVPTLNETGMLILGLLLAGAGYLLLRKGSGVV